MKEEDPLKNLLILHGGGPTAVLNASLYGALEAAKADRTVGKILAARGGSGGLLRRAWIDLRQVPAPQLALLPQTPGSAIGSSRDRLGEGEYRAMAEILREEEIGYLLVTGGNGTMDTAGKIWQACQGAGFDIRVIGIPKTMDNDIAVTDHAPGYGSAARFIAGSTRELAADIRSLPIHVVILETSGRNAGWVAAASALAGEELGPDLICLPERPFVEEAFLEAVSRKLREKKGLLVVVSEGLRDSDGKPVADPAFTIGRDVYFGDVGGSLASLIQRKLGYKSRAEKPGLLGRASIAWQSATDREEAIQAGAFAARAVLAGESGKMAAFRRKPGEGYCCELFLAPFERVMMEEKKLPESFIRPDGFGVTEAFIRYASPLIGGDLPEMAGF